MKTYKSDMAQSIWPLLLSVQLRSFHARRRLFQVFHFWADGGDEQSPGTAPQASVASQSSAQSISGSTGQRCTNRWTCGFVGWKPVLSPAGYQDYCQWLILRNGDLSLVPNMVYLRFDKPPRRNADTRKQRCLKICEIP